MRSMWAGMGSAMNRHGNGYLMRVPFRTDVDVAEPDYVGKFSETLRISADSQIVGVDWSVRGEVTVTYLVWGESPLSMQASDTP